MAEFSLDDWFETQILPHEGILMRYLRRVRTNPADVAEMRQDIYVRVYESAAKALPAAPKAFLMSTARHLVVDRIRHERVVSIDFTQDFDALNVLVDEGSPEQRVGARQELRRLSDALDQLSEQCRAVVWLRRVEGLSQREVAERLRMQEGTVASHLCRGLQVLTKVALGGGYEVPDEKNGSKKDSGSENSRG